MNLIVGTHAIRQALLARSGQRLYIKSGQLNARLQSLVVFAREQGVEVVVAEPSDMTELKHQGAVLEVLPPAILNEKGLDHWLIDLPEDCLVLVLDSVTDPRNFGACLRSAASYGVSAVVVPKDNSAPLNPAAIKTASGGASLVPVYSVVNLGRALSKLQEAGLWLVGTDLSAESSLDQVDLKGPIAIVMGSEDKGIRQKTRKLCDFLAQIPAPMPDLSLNVAVATGICLYEVHSQRLRRD